jgi:phosphatidylethanolamine/phosphatidyl-N-methylethanolamine N-methyltransferase
MDLTGVDRVYSKYAAVYDALFGKIFHEGRQRALEVLDPAPGERVLEVGVGTGLSLSLYPRHCQVLGLDYCAEMLDKAVARVREQGLDHVDLVRMDAGRMALPDDSFDRVLAAYVVTAVPDYRKAMSEMVRVCRPGGRILMLNHFVNGSKILGTVERAISPLCIHLGFRTDLSVEQVVRGHPLHVVRDEPLSLAGMWHLVECVNAKERRAPA